MSPPPARVVFLDIDGVLQPTAGQKRFDHDLVADRTCDPHDAPHYRAGEVKQYLDSHPEFERFVIIDDRYRDKFDRLFAEHFVHTDRFLDDSAALRARQILAGGPVTQENRHHRTLVFGPYRHLSG